MSALKGLSQVSRSRNGVGAFVLPCRKITLQYCNWGGSSQGMRDFLRLRLPKFAQEHPEIEFKVSEKKGFHPVIKGEYSGDLIKSICVRKWNIDIVENKLKILVNASGKKLSKPKQNVKSMNESVRGIWSPFHVDPDHRFKI